MQICFFNQGIYVFVSTFVNVLSNQELVAGRANQIMSTLEKESTCVARRVYELPAMPLKIGT